MKSILSSFKRMQAFSFLVGMSFGAALGLILFCYFVPHGPKAIGMLQHYASHMRGHEKVAERNRDAFRALYASSSAQMPAGVHSTHSSNNPYMMSEVLTEMQFLEDMIAHHQAAVVMAEQVLGLKNIHQEVKDLAGAIIKAQTTEVKQMKDWITVWKW